MNQELNLIEQEATEGLNSVRRALSLFPDNVILIQFFAALSTTLLFIENSRSRIQTIVESISPPDATAEEIEESGEYLATLLGVVLETKIRIERIINSLGNLS